MQSMVATELAPFDVNKLTANNKIERANFPMRKICPFAIYFLTCLVNVKRSKLGCYHCVALCFLFFTEGVAQTAILERSITLKVQNAALGEVLKTVSQQGNFYFSYNSNILDANKKITVSAQSQPVRSVMRTVLGDNYELKEKGNYIIIRKLKPDEKLIGGYISDQKTGQKLPNVTVYDKKSLKSATTDKSGYYEIVSRGEPIKELSVARLNYGDTVLQVRSEKATPQYLDVSLLPMPTMPEPEPIIEKSKTNIDIDKGFTEQVILSPATIERWLRSGIRTVERVNDQNIKSELQRNWHISLFPYVGSNLGLSGNVVNNMSFNATVGYSAGNRILELGGLGNINRGRVSGLQVGSLFNVVTKDMSGVQIASIVNRAKDMRGVQVTCITNTCEILRGGQISFVNNYANRGKAGLQIAGIVNKTVKGKTSVQIAGITNDADTVGVQIGLLNSAKKLSGFQLGLVNVSDTASGIVLGLLNVVKKGYHVLEVSNNDGLFLNLAYKTGTRKFYTNYMGSIRADTTAFGQHPFWSLGFGFGSWIPLSKNERWRLTLDFTAQHFSTGVFSSKWGHEVFRFAPALNLQMSKKLGLAIAPTFNAYSSNALDETETGVFRKQIVPSNTLGEVRQSGKWTYWFGGYAALRFF